MKKVLLTLLTSIMLLTLPVTTVYASSLDDVVSETSPESSSSSSSDSSSDSSSVSSSKSKIPMTADEYIANTKDAADLTNVDTKGASKVNEGIKTVAAFIVKILSYFLTAFLVVRVLLDLVYIALPFTRSMLSNGYAGNAAAGGSGMGGMGGMGSPMGGMGGMGMGGMGMGMRGGYGMNRMGMGGMGMGGAGMGGSQMGASPAMGRVQLVSTAALNSVASENMPGPDGRPQSALKAYAKDMAVTLVITPVLLVLAITGVLSNLGFLLGDVIARGIASIGNMI